jgi:hypothetical protein
VRWSPDGRSISFVAAVREAGHTRVRVHLVSAAGGPAEPVPPLEPAGRVGDACWLPDGALVFEEELTVFSDQTVLRRLDPKTRRVTTLSDSKGLGAPKCARNGRIFAVDTSDYADQEAKKRFVYKMLEPGRDVWTSYVLPVNIGYPNWSRDGRFIYAEHGGRLYRLELTTGHLEPIAQIDDFRLGHPWMGLAPDDSPLVLRDATQWDIYRLDWEAP